MSITRKLINWTTFSGLLLATAFTSTSALAVEDTLPGIIDASLPQFQSNVTIKQVKLKGQPTNTWSISGNAGTFFAGILESDQYRIKGGGKFNATVNWDPIGDGQGGFLSGDVRIDGKINNESILMTADLISYLWDADDTGTGSGSWLGFNTANILCSDSLNALIGGGGCTTAESLLIQLKNGWDGRELALPNKGLGGTATTSVPLPAAAWLFISGLGLMGVTARRKQKTVV